MMKKNILVIVLLIAMLFISSACNNNNAEEERLEAMICPVKLSYADEFGFDFRLIRDGVRVEQREPFDPATGRFGRIAVTISTLTDPRYETFTDFYTELVFVHSEEEALGFPDNVIVAWPQEGTVQGIIDGLNWQTYRAEIDLAEFGLIYPIAITNLLDDWEAIRALTDDTRFTLSTRDIVNCAIMHGDEAWILSLEVIRLGGCQEVELEVHRTVRELNMTRTDGVALLRAAGNFETFFNATNRMNAVGLTVEEILSELESATVGATSD